MPRISAFKAPPELVLGSRIAARVPEGDQRRQRAEVDEILTRLRTQPGVILADEVGMGKTFVALSVAYSIAASSPRGPVIVMVPANLVDKWEQDLKTFSELYLDGRHPVRTGRVVTSKALRAPGAFIYGIARHSIELMKLLDDAPRERCHLIFLAQGAMARRQSDKWIRLALIAEAMRRHGRGGGKRLIQVKQQIHRFVAELIWAIGEQRASDWGDQLWQSLIRSDPSAWRRIYNESLREGREALGDDPVPKGVTRAIHRLDLRTLADALEQMPVRARGGSSRVAERIAVARRTLRQIEGDLWKQLLASARWRSPLLVMDEAHHLKNPATALARQLQSPDSEIDLRTGDGAMSQAFDRMLFLTATPFQLGHHELIRVLERFGDVRWDSSATLGDRTVFMERLQALGQSLTDSQRTAIALQRCWRKLRPEDGPADQESDMWWTVLCQSSSDKRTPRQNALVDAFEQATRYRKNAEQQLRIWIIRYNKPDCWSGTVVQRRHRFDGDRILDWAGAKPGRVPRGLEIPPKQLLPFFLAARSAAAHGHDLLGEALCSSYEAFRFTRSTRQLDKDQLDADSIGGAEPSSTDLTGSTWYLAEFDTAMTACTGGIHPKMAATVQTVVDLWEHGEKVLVFAFYRQTCRALRIHISTEIERRMARLACQRFATAGIEVTDAQVREIVDRVQDRYFDRIKAPGRVALDQALTNLIHQRQADMVTHAVSDAQQEQLMEVMRRFLRVSTTLVRCFPIYAHDTLPPAEAVHLMLETQDASRISWRRKFQSFLDYLLTGCSSGERADCLDAAQHTQTRDIRVETDENEEDGVRSESVAKGAVATLANVQVATGLTRRETRSRLMRAFNTPFFPDILVCSQVMGEGVDLQRSCRHVIHHDLAWNPSSIEQRTGRIDRLGCKAEGRQSICVYLPYIAGTADERQYKVMCERESWFRVVMGQNEVANLVPADAEHEQLPVPNAIASQLTFRLELHEAGATTQASTLESIIDS